jgi:putative endonuclease
LFYIDALHIYLIVRKTKQIDCCASAAMERRLHEHNIGHSKFTKLGMPCVLKYTEEFKTLIEAKQREMAKKTKVQKTYSTINRIAQTH